MSPRTGERGGRAGAEVRLLHPERAVARRCRVDAGPRGLVLRPVHPAGRRVRVPWWAVQGFDADGTAPGPDGDRWQVLAVVTDAGTLSLQCPALECSALIAGIGRHAARWRRARRPTHAASARLLALLAGNVAVPLGSLVVNSLGGAGLAVGGGLARAAVAARHAAARWPVAAGSVGVSVIVMAVLLAVTASPAAPTLPTARTAARHPFATSGMAHLALAAAHRASLDLAAATAAPAPAPASVTDLPPLRPHEVFGFAPYWTLDQSGGFPVQGLTTIAYFALGVNADGTLAESGPGWQGYQSQALADLVTRAHAAGDRVVLTVDDFSQASLDQLTSSPQAAATLAGAVVRAVAAKNLDGVNLDFEGQGPADQAGLTRLVGTVATALHAADPHDQVTMDTYASAAGDPGGFYDVRALAPEVDGLFVMAYGLNLRGAPSADSPLTSAMFSDQAALAQYTAAVPASKIVLGLPYYGYDWPTTNGTMSASATGTPTPVATGQVLASGRTLYWDPVTQTAWSAYEAGGQWHETYFEDPTSMYQAVELAASYHVAGVGAWALGMDGNDPAMIGALDGVAPPVDAVPGPLGTPGAAPPTQRTTQAQATPAPAGPPPSTTTSTGPTGTGPTTSTTGPPGSTTTTTPGSTTTTTPGSTTTTVPDTTTTTVPDTTTTTTTGYATSGLWQGQRVTLTPASGPPPSGTPTPLGTLTGFQTTDPALACLASGPSLPVVHYPGTPDDVVTASSPADCATARFTFPAGGT